MQSLTAVAQDSLDTMPQTHLSRYERRVHRIHRYWESLIPTQSVVQYAGGMGVISLGVGWNYGRHRQWETHLLIGWLPKFDSNRAKMTMTLKENFIPWNIRIAEGWSLEPLECGLYLNTIFGHEFWSHTPHRYPNNYYWFSTRVRPNLFVGERITYTIPHNKRKWMKSLTGFYEIGTCDLYLVDWVSNRHVKAWEVVSLSLGVKFQLL